MKDASVSVGRDALVTRARDRRVFFGWRSDPFVFDQRLVQQHEVHRRRVSSPTKTFAALCLSSLLGLRKQGRGLWARTVEKTGGSWIQGRPRWTTLTGRFSAGRLKGGEPQRPARGRETQSRSRESCCQTFFPMNLTALRPFLTMAGHFALMLSTSSSPYTVAGLRPRRIWTRDQDRAGVGCLPCLDHAAGQASMSQGLHKPDDVEQRFGVLRRASRALAIRGRRMANATRRHEWLLVHHCVWLLPRYATRNRG